MGFGTNWRGFWGERDPQSMALEMRAGQVLPLWINPRRAATQSSRSMDKLELSEMVATKQIDGRRDMDDRLNPWLTAGWRLIKIWTVDTGPPDTKYEGVCCLLGWPAINESEPYEPYDPVSDEDALSFETLTLPTHSS